MSQSPLLCRLRRAATTRARRLARAALPAAAILLLGAGSAWSQTLVSDKDDYPPGAIAYLSGEGFQPFEVVALSISIDDVTTGLHIASFDWTVEAADAEGTFVTTYEVPQQALNMTLTATAMGLSSGGVASTTFTDAEPFKFSFRTAGIPSGISISSVSGIKPNPGNDKPQDYTTAAFLSPGPSAQETSGVGQITFNFPSAVAVPGGTYNFVSATHPSPFPAGAGGTEMTITGTYSFVPGCTATNSAPTLSASDKDFGDVCPPTGTFEATVTVSDFMAVGADGQDPVTVTFDDGSTSKPVSLSVSNTSVQFTLKATDDPSARNQPGCPELAPLMTTKTVTVSAVVHEQPTNDPPVVTASNYDLGDICLSSGTDLPVPVDPSVFGAGATDPDGDPVVSLVTSVTSVTLVLPEGMTSKTVQVPVIVSATDDPSGRNDPLCDPLEAKTGEKTVYVKATLHRNHAPTITASDLSLPDIVGCLFGGSFESTLPVAPSDFSPVTGDQDNDPRTVTASVTQVTLVGPGLAEACVELTATDDPSGRASCLVAMTAKTTVKVKARIVYGFGPSKFLSPLNDFQATKAKRGSTVPVKFQIYDCGGTPITTGVHTICVLPDMPMVPAGDPTVDDPGSSFDNDTKFKFNAPHWQYNLKTDTSYVIGSTYIVRAKLADGTFHDVRIAITK